MHVDRLPCRSVVLPTYYYATLPFRWWANRRAIQQGRVPISVLFYHRIADSSPNDWTITHDQFQRHIEWIRTHFDLISLSEAQQRIRGKHNERPAVSITFDDGYADNCQFALPRLVELEIPCTYFVSTHHVLYDAPFPHDVDNNRPLRPNSIEQLRELAAAGVEIGAHTRTHADLGKTHDPQTLYDEVVAARVELQNALRYPVRYFAFPYGQPANLNRAAFRLAQDAGYEAVCSAYGGYNYPGDDPFHIQRIHADPEMIRLKNWLTMDPRKQRMTPRYQFVLSEGDSPSLIQGNQAGPPPFDAHDVEDDRTNATLVERVP